MSFGGGGQQTTTNEFKPPAWAAQYWPNYVASGVTLSQTPYMQSGLPSVAPINDYQMGAAQLAYNRAFYGAPDINAGRGAAMNAAAGNYANPYAGNIGGIASGNAYNPWGAGVADLLGSGPNPGSAMAFNVAGMAANPYADPSYAAAVINNTANQMAKAYSVGGAAQNDAASNMAGAYGGSAYQEMKDRGEASLAQQIGNMAASVGQQEQQYMGNMYNQSLQNALAGIGLGGNLYNSGYANQLAALGLGSNMYNSDVGNQLAANAQAGGFWNNDIANILSGAALTGNLSQDDYTSAVGLMNAGNMWNTYYQKLLDQYNNAWNTENTYDANMNEYLGSVLGRASGSWGTTATSQPGMSPLAGLLGAGAAAYGAYKLF